ncbi:MAG: C1 family peptidase, partial [Parafannyhessea umbonata]|nr:C1 family peptidase [Parafannyhessea umbonata]
GVDLSMTRADMIDARETSLTHAMCFQGVELDADGQPKAWRIENSWGKDQGKDGYLVMSADWFRLYGGEVDVRREFVPADVLKLWDEAPVEDVAPWSNICHALGTRD